MPTAQKYFPIMIIYGLMRVKACKKSLAAESVVIQADNGQCERPTTRNYSSLLLLNVIISGQHFARGYFHDVSKEGKGYYICSSFFPFT